jgi:hypothetical protein
MRKFNINDYMYIQITDCITADAYKHEIQGETWYKIQCWDVFNLLPPRFTSKPLFNTNVMFDDKPPKHGIKNSGQAVSKYVETHPLSRSMASDPKLLARWLVGYTDWLHGILTESESHDFVDFVEEFEKHCVKTGYKKY